MDAKGDSFVQRTALGFLLCFANFLPVSDCPVGDQFFVPLLHPGALPNDSLEWRAGHRRVIFGFAH